MNCLPHKHSSYNCKPLPRTTLRYPPCNCGSKTCGKKLKRKPNRWPGGDRSLANKAAEYQRLALDREFADKQLGSALASLEQARNEAQRKQLYLERIVQPSKPDMAMEPRRIRGVFTTLVLGLIAWGILSMLMAGVKEHQD